MLHILRIGICLLKMNILIIGNGSTGVDENNCMFINKHTGNFLNGLRKYFNVSFCQFGVVYSKESDLSSFSLTDNKIISIIFPSLKNPLSFFKAINLILKSDFVYLFFPGNLSRVFGLLSILLGKKFGIYLRGQYFSEYWFDKIILRKASFILTVSPFFIDLLKSINLNVEVIKPMIDISMDDLYLEDRSWDKQVLRILTVGRVEKRKGIDELLDIAKMLRESGVSFVWDVVGGGESITKYKDRVSYMNLESHILFHGQISEKNELNTFYKNSDIFVFLSHDEGFPRVLYEAMAFKLPIFTTFVGGIPGRMVDKVNCFELPVRNSVKSFHILLSYLNHPLDIEFVSNEGQNTLKDMIIGGLKSHEELVIKNFKNS